MTNDVSRRDPQSSAPPRRRGRRLLLTTALLGTLGATSVAAAPPGLIDWHLGWHSLQSWWDSPLGAALPDLAHQASRAVSEGARTAPGESGGLDLHGAVLLGLSVVVALLKLQHRVR
jgi:hypothetical protein